MQALEHQQPIVLFDGVCNLCSSIVQFIIRHDTAGKFRFASLQSDIGQRLTVMYQLPANPDTFVLITENRAYTKSTGALRLAKELGGMWSLFYLLIIVPKPIRDYLYAFIAKNRYKWFGKKDSCLLPARELKDRFLG